MQRSLLPPKDVSEVTAALRHALDSRTQPPASIIHAATEFARILTGAQGVALGIRLKGSLLCRARSGDLAPELGSALNAESGITGQCLRSASVLVCDDSESDERTDREACRALGVRSIVAVPIRATPGVLGLLEAFSSSPSAFTQEHVDALRALVEVIELAHAFDKPEHERDAVGQARPVLTRQLAAPRDSASVIPVAKLSPQILNGQKSWRGYWIAAVAAVVLLLGSLAVWLSWHDPTPETAASESAAPVQEMVPVKPAAQHTIFLKPEAGILTERLRARKDGTQATDGLIKASEIEPISEEHARDKSVLPPEEVGEGFIKSAPSNVAEPGPVNLTPAMNAPNLNVLTSAATPMPALENENARVSQGATEAKLVRQVQPVYPAQARAMRLTGDVVLHGTIAEDGSLRGLRVVSGPPVLAAAAIAAVQQWRYTPSLLNGKPVAVEKQITLVFKLP